MVAIPAWTTGVLAEVVGAERPRSPADTSDPLDGGLTVGAVARSSRTGRREAPGYYLLVVSISSISALPAAVRGIL